MADVDRRRFLAAIGLVPATVLLLTACPGGEGDEDEEEGDEGDDD